MRAFVIFTALREHVSLGTRHNIMVSYDDFYQTNTLLNASTSLASFTAFGADNSIAGQYTARSLDHGYPTRHPATSIGAMNAPRQSAPTQKENVLNLLSSHNKVQEVTAVVEPLSIKYEAKLATCIDASIQGSAL